MRLPATMTAPTDRPDGSGPAASARPVKRSFSIAGHRTSVSLEAAFWSALKEAARRQGTSVAALVARIDATRGSAGLSSAIRVWLLQEAGGAQHDDRFSG